MRHGEEYLAEVLRKRREKTRQDEPAPYDDDWGWWIEKRLARIEDGQRWIIRLAGGILIAEVIRAALSFALQ